MIDPERGRTTTGKDVEKIYVAIYDYDARTDEDLTFRVGDLLYVVDDRLVLYLQIFETRLEYIYVDILSQNDWWLAKHCQSGLQGYIPALYVAPHGGLDVNE